MNLLQLTGTKVPGDRMLCQVQSIKAQVRRVFYYWNKRKILKASLLEVRRMKDHFEVICEPKDLKEARIKLKKKIYEY